MKSDLINGRRLNTYWKWSKKWRITPRNSERNGDGQAAYATGTKIACQKREGDGLQASVNLSHQGFYSRESPQQFSAENWDVFRDGSLSGQPVRLLASLEMSLFRISSWWLWVPWWKKVLCLCLFMWQIRLSCGYIHGSKLLNSRKYIFRTGICYCLYVHFMTINVTYGLCH